MSDSRGDGRIFCDHTHDHDHWPEVGVRRTWCPRCWFFIHTTDPVKWHRIRVCRWCRQHG